MPPDNQPGVRVTGRNIVTAASPEAVQAGLEMLRTGGNAADAAAATLLVSCVTHLGAVCFGGEAAVLVFDASAGATVVLAAQGAAPANRAAIEWILNERKRLTGIRNATAPAILDLCVTLLQQFGSKSLAEAAAPAIDLLERGRPAAYFDTSLRTQIDAQSGTPPAAGGTPEREWWRDAARTLRAMSHAEGRAASRTAALESAVDVVRSGSVADQLAAWYAAADGFLGKRDLESHRTECEAPLTLAYRDHLVCKAGAWTQGPWVLQALRMLDADPTPPSSEVARCHLLAEVIKWSMADRDRHYGDPRLVAVPIEQLFSQEYAALRRGLIDPHAAGLAVPGDPMRMLPRLAPTLPSSSGDSTIACITADRSGNVVVMTPSGVGSTAGSGGPTGITHGTRLLSAGREPNHPNTIAAGKRPCVTLSPTLLLKSGKPVAAITVPGGHFQDQIALHLLLRIVDNGWRLDEILERDDRAAPVLIHRSGSAATVRVQRRIASEVGDALRELGHAVEPTALSFCTLGGSIAFFDAEGGEIDAYGLQAGAV